MKKHRNFFIDKLTIVAFVVALIVTGIMYYAWLPVLSYGFEDLPFFLMVFGGIIAFVDAILHAPQKKLNKFGTTIAVIGFLLLTVVPFITSAPIFHAKAYNQLIGSVEESKFEKDVSPIAVDEIRIVDEQMAMTLGDKKLGEVPALGSQAKLGKFHIQKVKNELYWVAPLVHPNFVKWLTNMEGSLGYVMVSASDPQDVRLVQELDGKPIKIKYQPEAYFNQDLERKLVFSGVATVGRTDFTLEIDDNGRPFWVVSLYKNKVGYGGSDAVGVATVDAQTGEVKRYGIEDAPSWIDRIQPEEFVNNQIYDWGRYKKGWFNAKISESGVIQPTEGMSLVYGKDNQAYWYTGLTSSGADQSTIGFILVNTRTKESKLYLQPGATEAAAMQSAEGKVQEKQYQATFPVMYNIMDKPTYVLALKDKAGLVKMVSMVSVEDFSTLGIGDTKEEALRNYRSALRDKGNSTDISENVGGKRVEGEVIRINQDVQNGNTYYYVMLKEHQDIIFVGNSKISEELPLTQIGDKVTVQYDTESQNLQDISGFENNSLR